MYSSSALISAFMTKSSLYGVQYVLHADLYMTLRLEATCITHHLAVQPPATGGKIVIPRISGLS